MHRGACPRAQRSSAAESKRRFSCDHDDARTKFSTVYRIGVGHTTYVTRSSGCVFFCFFFLFSFFIEMPRNVLRRHASAHHQRSSSDFVFSANLSFPPSAALPISSRLMLLCVSRVRRTSTKFPSADREYWWCQLIEEFFLANASERARDIERSESVWRQESCIVYFLWCWW